MKRFCLLAFAAAFGLSACVSDPQKPEEEVVAPVAPKPPEPTAAEKAVAKKAEVNLANGIKAYENGDYKTSQSELQGALALGLANRVDQMRANKYLAFIACAGNQRDVCKTHFLKAFAISPKFSLAKSEAGHPVWGPVFLEAKAEAAKRK